MYYIYIDNNNNNDDDNHDNSDKIHQWITTIRIIGSYWYYPPVDEQFDPGSHRGWKIRVTTNQ